MKVTIVKEDGKYLLKSKSYKTLRGLVKSVDSHPKMSITVSADILREYNDKA